MVWHFLTIYIGAVAFLVIYIGDVTFPDHIHLRCSISGHRFDGLVFHDHIYLRCSISRHIY